MVVDETLVDETVDETGVYKLSLVPRPSPALVFDRLQYFAHCK